MDHRSAGRRDLVLLVTTVVGLTRLAEGPLLWLAAGMVLVGVLLGALQVLGEGEPRGVPIESLLLPATAAVAGVFGLRLVPLGPLVLLGLAVIGVLLDRSIALEQRLEALASPPSVDDRTKVVGLATGIAFLGFAGVAATVPGGLVADSSVLGPPGGSLVGTDLALLAGADALLALLLGYRVSALRATTVRDAAWSALTYAVVVAISAGAIRALAVPRLLGPALLTLVFFLWDAFHGAAPTRRRDPRWLWEVGLLIALGVLVIALNTRLGA
jgi:hypothetical protein